VWIWDRRARIDLTRLVLDALLKRIWKLARARRVTGARRVVVTGIQVGRGR
jgi:hypothetical protein